MKNLRKYGNAPFNVTVIHGGPGASGEMAPVARKLSSNWGVLEPLQTEASLDEQIKELHAILKKNGDVPVTLIGHSWGAILSFIFTARYPSFIKKIILIGSGCFEEKYTRNIMKTRLDRLSKEERTQVFNLMKTLQDPTVKDKNTPLTQFGKLISKADSYAPLQHESEALECNFKIYRSIWKDVEKLRRSGKLLKLGKQIQCPVVAIHGDYDPHPSEGIKDPLSRVLTNFRFILLAKCGHCPWIERDARDNFYNILKKELKLEFKRWQKSL